MKVTYYGHSTFLIEIEGTRLLMDPFMSDNEACEIDPLSVDCDYILITHGHWDHMADAESIAKRTGAKLICNYEIGNWYIAKGLENVIQMNQGGTIKMGFGSIKYVSAVHSSSLPDGSYGGNPGGFILSGGGHEVYYAGDTALSMEMELLGRHHNLTLALLPIGDTYTMGYQDGAIASEMIECKEVIGMHFDTWPPLAIDHDAARAAFEAKGAGLTLMEIGQQLEY
jgi:L-ascorbate metabolism protein UlaG (beta-lactamase superfamily)